VRDGGADARFVQLDVTGEKSVARAAEWIAAEFGRLDILVNNAGISVHLATLPEDGPSGLLWGHLWTVDGPESTGTLPW
jgi:NAD(P)-dependent dehydrogenase (short-subunit alcohol dehydrogenase family)